jgi:ribosomal protein L37AE/L43A
MRIEDMHLQEGEVEKLVNYLMSKRSKHKGRLSKNPIVRTLKARIGSATDQFSSYPLIRATIDQEEADAKEYERCSQYGRTRLEIYKRAARHIRNCQDCRMIYQGHITQTAERISEGLGDFVRRFEIQRHAGDFAALQRDSFILTFDVLNIFDHGILVRRMFGRE